MSDQNAQLEAALSTLEADRGEGAELVARVEKAERERAAADKLRLEALQEVERLRTLMTAAGVHQCEDGVTEQCRVCDQRLHGAILGTRAQPAPVSTQKSQPVLPVALEMTRVAYRLTADPIMDALRLLTGMSTADIRAALVARAEAGVKKYGTPLMSHNGRDAREDLRQELLDALMYAAQMEMEREP